MSDVLYICLRCLAVLLTIMSGIFCPSAAPAAVLGTGTVSSSVSTAPAHPFVVYDGTLYKNKPSLSGYGIKPINILYVSRFWDNWNNNPRKDELPDEKIVRQLAREAKDKDELVVLDIEHWALSGIDEVVTNSLEKYSTVLRWFRNEAPKLQVGYFGIMPRADYFGSRKGVDSRDYQTWQKENDRLRPLAGMVNVIFPYLYTFYPNQHDWVNFAVENIKEARRYGKPVYVFLWPQYSETNMLLAHQYIPKDFWRLQLETAREYADGIVIWGGWSKNGPEEWDDKAAWWQVTKEFMEKLDN